MLFHRLGKTNLQISGVGLGGWAARQTVLAALDSGINLIDTAPIYADSERLLGRALKGKRHQVVLATKCGLVKNGSWTDHDLKEQTIITQLETSLKNLQTDYVDLYFIHYLDPNVPWQEALQTLIRLQQSGKIRYIGVCNIAENILREMLETGVISCVQDELSLLHRHKASGILPLCQRYDVGFMAYGSLCGGILSGKYTREPNLRRADARNYFYKCYRGESFAAAQQQVQRVKALAAQKNSTPAQIALAWVLNQPGVTCALTGARRAEQIVQNAAAAQITLTTDELCKLQALNNI